MKITHLVFRLFKLTLLSSTMVLLVAAKSAPREEKITSASAKTGKEVEKLLCYSTREYVTSLEFLRDQKDFKLSEAQAREVADQVSKGCEGAARRFTRVVRLLTQTGVLTHEAIKVGVRFAMADAEKTEAFAEIFQKGFLQNYLDLDLPSALQLALSLSIDFEGNVHQAREDFAQLVKYCVSTEHLDLPRPLCATLAGKVTRLGQDYESRIAPSFIHLVEYLLSNGGPQLPTDQALHLSEELIQYGPTVVDNFKQAYRYGTSKKGLALDGQGALTFAKQMASRSVFVEHH